MDLIKNISCDYSAYKITFPSFNFSNLCLRSKGFAIQKYNKYLTLLISRPSCSPGMLWRWWEPDGSRWISPRQNTGSDHRGVKTSPAEQGGNPRKPTAWSGETCYGKSSWIISFTLQSGIWLWFQNNVDFLMRRTHVSVAYLAELGIAVAVVLRSFG